MKSTTHHSPLTTHSEPPRKPVWQESACKDCVFWIKKEMPAGAVGNPKLGECRRRPPSATGIAAVQQQGEGILIAGQRHVNVAVNQLAVLGNYPPIAAENPACGDFVAAAPFDQTVDQALRTAKEILPPD